MEDDPEFDMKKANRKLTFVKLGARVLFRPQDLEDFIKSRLVQARAGPQEETP